MTSFTLKLLDTTHKAVKVKAAQDGKTMHDVMVELIEAGLVDKPDEEE